MPRPKLGRIQITRTISKESSTKLNEMSVSGSLPEGNLLDQAIEMLYRSRK